VTSEKEYSEDADNAVGGAGGAGGLTPAPFLVKVDRYGSVSGLVRVRVPLGMLVIHTERSEVPLWPL